MIEGDVRSEITQLLGDDVRFDVPMARFTSMRVGGPVDALVEPRDREQLARLLAIAHEGGIAVMPIGEGFNTIVTDDGLEGIAIKLSHFRELELRGGAQAAKQRVFVR